jgi:hypothetical protein
MPKLSNREKVAVIKQAWVTAEYDRDDPTQADLPTAIKEIEFLVEELDRLYEKLDQLEVVDG